MARRSPFDDDWRAKVVLNAKGAENAENAEKNLVLVLDSSATSAKPLRPLRSKILGVPTKQPSKSH
jgi:hypothetical protein